MADVRFHNDFLNLYYLLDTGTRVTFPKIPKCMYDFPADQVSYMNTDMKILEI